MAGNLPAVLSRPAERANSKHRCACSTSASPPTPGPSGAWHSRSAISHTTARSTPSRATATGRGHAASSSTRPAARLRPPYCRWCQTTGFRLVQPGQCARGHAGRWHGHIPGHAHAHSAGLAELRHHGCRPEGVLRVPPHAHGTVGRPGGHRAHGRPLRGLRAWTATVCDRRATWLPAIATSPWPPRSACTTTIPASVERKGRLKPGQMLAADTQTGELLLPRDVDTRLKSRHPYRQLDQGPQGFAEVHARRRAADHHAAVTLTTWWCSRSCSRSPTRSAIRSSVCSPRPARRPSDRWATTRQCRCCRVRCARSTTASASSSPRSPIRPSIRCANRS